MQYKYCENENFEDLACGRVLIHRTGFPNFPIRLAQEIFCRCKAYLGKQNGIRLYDPCCGGAYLLTVLGFLNPDSLDSIAGSDISREAVDLAGENLSLLTREGLRRRIDALRELYSLHGKDSHLQAVESGERLLQRLEQAASLPHTRVFVNDLFSPNFPEEAFRADIVFLDVPYGNLVQWQGDSPSSARLLDSLLPVLTPDSVVAVCSDKSQKFSSPQFQRLEKQSAGKRVFQIFRPL